MVLLFVFLLGQPGITRQIKLINIILIQCAQQWKPFWPKLTNSVCLCGHINHLGDPSH
jgi:hypothetical protein